MQGYQVLKESFYDVCRRRKLKLDEVALAIYLRGKYCYFGTPVFQLFDKEIYDELNTSWRILDKVRKRLQLKGVIKYNPGKGRGNPTEYTMIDTVMAPHLDRKPYEMVKKTLRNGRVFLNRKPYEMVTPIYKSNKSNKSKYKKSNNNNDMKSARWQKPTTHIKDEIAKILNKKSTME